MNGKVAKRLRRIARSQTAGLPMKNVIPQKYRRFFMKGEKRIEYMSVTHRLGSCTRAVYQALKRGYKRYAA